MRDIPRRIERYRLGRYGVPASLPGRRMLWIVIAALAWVVWAGFISDHSLYRIWRLSRENDAAKRDLTRLQGEIATLERDAHDPGVARQRAERWLRERGGMAQPGEIIYRIEDAPKDSVAR